MAVVELKVWMHCDRCIKAIKKAIKKIEDIETYRVDTSLNKITVTGNVTAEQQKGILETWNVQVMITVSEFPGKRKISEHSCTFVLLQICNNLFSLERTQTSKFWCKQLDGIMQRCICTTKNVILMFS
ncbi:hypothetical protein ACLOJK_013569 [Asimina triloba]